MRRVISQLGTIAGLNAHVVNAYATSSITRWSDPAAYDLTNVTSPVWSGSYTSASSGTLATTSTAAQDQYLFWDQLHPTETGHQAIADLGEQLLSGSFPLIVTDTTTKQTSTQQDSPTPARSAACSSNTSASPPTA